MTFGACGAHGRRILEASRMTHSPALDAAVLLAYASGRSREALYLHDNDEVSPAIQSAYDALVQQRALGVPVAYLTGMKEFFGRAFSVDERVLIPRPDTEILVETALDLLAPPGHAAVLDLCTGSGAVGITLACESPDITTTLSDLSPDALEVAKNNCIRLTTLPIECVQGDLYEPVKGRLFDLVVSNPPYLTGAWIAEGKEQIGFEPHLALDGGGSDGMDILRRIISATQEHLTPGGWLVLECDHRQAIPVSVLMQTHGYTEIRIHKDIAALDRVVAGRKPCTKN